MRTRKRKGFDGYINGIEAVINGHKHCVEIFRNNNWGSTEVKSIEVNWGALGSQSPDTAEQYAHLILRAVKEARKQLSKITK